METYERVDKTHVKKIVTTEVVFDEKAVVDEIKELQSKIDLIPEPKTEPDQETLSFFNDHIHSVFDNMLELQLNEKQELLDILKNVK